MIRVPSFIHAGEFQSLKIKDMTFVAYRNQDPPLRNEVFFEEHALIFVLEGEKKFVTPEQDIRVKKGNVVFILVVIIPCRRLSINNIEVWFLF
jgi:hypothetical protein